MLGIIKTLNLVLAFTLEICMLAIVAYWGFHLKHSLLIRILAGIGVPAIFIGIWGIFLSPKAIITLELPVKISGKLLLFGIATTLLYSSGKTTLAIIFAVATAINLLLLITWKQ
ncbi:MAG: YrdB family protein [Chitinophagaceae bacterium]|nr:YrdB family protein [Chitinophagaceae bacterium]MCB9045037.1 YrdB family protein [Chitinophagales bacterium]